MLAYTSIQYYVSIVTSYHFSIPIILLSKYFRRFRKIGMKNLKRETLLQVPNIDRMLYLMRMKNVKRRQFKMLKFLGKVKKERETNFKTYSWKFSKLTKNVVSYSSGISIFLKFTFKNLLCYVTWGNKLNVETLSVPSELL